VEDMVNITPDHKELLKHPMLMAILMQKWRTIKHIYFVWMFIKFLFLFFLLTIAITEGQTLKDQRQLVTKNLTVKEMISNRETSDLSLTYLVPFTVLLVFMITVEIFQLGVSFTWWRKEMKNWFQLVILALSTLLAYDLFNKDKKTAELDLHILGMLLPMVFYEFLHESGYHPLAAKYILLLDKVFKTFFSYGIIYVGLVITPAISFFLIADPNVDQADSVYPTEFSKLLAKTFVMFVGEVELFDVSKSSETFKWLEIIFFLMFIFFLAVVLMNLLNALAIVDTRELLEDAEMETLYSLLETVSFWENLKANDPHKRLPCSFLSMIKVREYIGIFIPDMTGCSNKKVIKIRPFGYSRNVAKLSTILSKFSIMHEITGEQELHRAYGSQFGKDIVSRALDIFNKNKETEKIGKKEEDDPAWYVEVGPLFSHDHAHQKAEEFIQTYPDFKYTGHWKTTIEGKMSAIYIERRAENPKSLQMIVDSLGSDEDYFNQIPY